MPFYATPDPSRPMPDECEWTQKGASHYLDGRICHAPAVYVCDKQPREKYICARHAGAHKRERPRPCAEANHFLLVRP